MVFHYLSERRAAMGLESSLPARRGGWGFCRRSRGSGMEKY